MIQLHVYFSGVVQGVGFRYTVHRYATMLGARGWVRNLPDGRVEMKVEGTRAVLEELIAHLDRHFDGSIRDKEIYWDDNIENLTDFKITF